MSKIIAKSAKVEQGGLLPMKEGKEQEAKKSQAQKNQELCNFFKNAFCVDGEVQMVQGKIEVQPVHFVLNDSIRGQFLVALGK